MSISETVRATQTEESRQNQTHSQNFSANWQNRKVSIITPAAAGAAISATAIAVAATVLTGGIALIAFAIGGVAIAAGLGTSLFFAFKSPKSLEQSRTENITSQTASHAPTFEEMLARRREEFMQKMESVETEEAPVVEPPTTDDKPQEFDEVLQTKEGSSYSYGKIALGTLGLAALVEAIYVANANGINLNPLSYFSSPGNVTPDPQPTPKVVPSAQETVKPFVTQSANDSTPSVTPRPVQTPRFTAELPKAEQETSWVSKECMKFGQTLSKRFSEPYNKFFTAKPKDAWASADNTGWKMMSNKDTCYYPPKATSIDAARARRTPMVEFCNCMMDLWKTRNPAVTA